MFRPSRQLWLSSTPTTFASAMKKKALASAVSAATTRKLQVAKSTTPRKASPVKKVSSSAATLAKKAAVGSASMKKNKKSKKVVDLDDILVPAKGGTSSSIASPSVVPPQEWNPFVTAPAAPSASSSASSSIDLSDPFASSLDNMMSKISEAQSQSLDHLNNLKLEQSGGMVGSVGGGASLDLDSAEQNSLEQSRAVKTLKDFGLSRHFRFEGAFSERKSISDIILSQEEANASSYTFLIFPGVQDKVALAKALLAAYPTKLRRHHVCTGISGAPIDFYADLDIPHDVVTFIPLETVLKSVIRIVHDLMISVGLEPKHNLLLNSPGAKHHSFHLHIQCGNGCFADYSVLRPLVEEANVVFAKQIEQIFELKGIPTPDELYKFAPFDTAVYRRCGQVRLGSCVKISRPDCPLTAYQPELKELQDLTASTLRMTEAEQVALSMPVRINSEEYGKTIRATKATKEGSGIGRTVGRRMSEEKKEHRFKEVCACMVKYPADYAREYDTWVNVGCALFSFGPEFRDQALEMWMIFSRKCGEKYKPTSIRRYWDHSFRGGTSGTPLDENWHRGYYYLMGTIHGKTYRKLNNNAELEKAKTQDKNEGVSTE